jgi:hypothetical protein
LPKGGERAPMDVEEEGGAFPQETAGAVVRHKRPLPKSISRGYATRRDSHKGHRVDEQARKPMHNKARVHVVDDSVEGVPEEVPNRDGVHVAGGVAPAKGPVEGAVGRFGPDAVGGGGDDDDAVDLRDDVYFPWGQAWAKAGRTREEEPHHEFWTARGLEP